MHSTSTELWNSEKYNYWVIHEYLGINQYTSYTIQEQLSSEVHRVSLTRTEIYMNTYMPILYTMYIYMYIRNNSVEYNIHRIYIHAYTIYDVYLYVYQE